jgi:hypothetical protein
MRHSRTDVQLTVRGQDIVEASEDLLEHARELGSDKAE